MKATAKRNTHRAVVNPELEAKIDRIEMLSLFHRSANVTPDAVYRVAGYEAKLWGATSDSGAWVSMVMPGMMLLARPLRETDPEPTCELSTIDGIIDAHFRAVRDALKVVQKN